MLLSPAWLAAQENPAQPPADAQTATRAPNSDSDQVRALAETVHQLQLQVKALASELAELRGREKSAQTVSQNDTAAVQPPSSTAAAEQSAAPPSPAATSGAAAAAPGAQTAVPAPQPPAPTLEQRLEALEDAQQLADDKINDQYQTKVESGSKYRVRLSGIVLLNLFENRGSVDNIDFPELATGQSPLGSPGSFGGSLRQSQMGLDVFGPDIAGAHTSANIRFDFAGGFPDTPNGVTEGLVRLRTGTIRMDWNNTSLVGGQDYLFFAPLAPTSLATLAIPALSYSGNLWSWVPQVRVEHRLPLTQSSRLMLQAGILDPLTGDLPYDSYYRYPSWGEMSGQPAYAGRVAWSRHVSDQDVTLGAGAYYGRQDWGFGRNFNSWAGTMDLTVPLGKFFLLTGEFYRGQAVGGLGGGIGQDVVLNGLVTSPATEVEGLDSMGGWAQLKFKPTAKVEVNGAFGQDNPFANQLREYNSTSLSYYGELLARNRSPMLNVIYQVRSNVLLSAEFRLLRTFGLDDSFMANHINLSAGYQF